MILDESPASPAPERKPESGTSITRFKVRIRFRKDGALRFLGHHDIVRVWERLFRRADLPLRFSEGFHPKPRLSSPLALSVGVVGAEEILDIELTCPLPAEIIRARVEAQLVEGLSLVSVEALTPGSSTQVTEVVYDCLAPSTVSVDDWHEKIRAFELATSLVVERHLPGKPLKTIDLKHFVKEVALVDGRLSMTLTVSPAGTARPEEILKALGLSASDCKGIVFTRRHVRLESKSSIAKTAPLNLPVESSDS